MTHTVLREQAGPAGTSDRPPSRVGSGLGVAGILVPGLLAAGALSLLHLTQGTSAVDAADLLRLLTGSGDGDVMAVLTGSRLPRLLAAVTVGVALGAAGAALQSVARNALASPDTLAVNAGAHFAVVVAAALGVSLPVLPAGGLAFVGGLAAAGLVLALSAGGAAGPTRLILAGSATALALASFTTLFLLLFEQETLGLFAWGNGSLTQTGLEGVQQMAPVVVVGVAGLLLLSHRLDVLALGDDTAGVLGLAVRRVRFATIVLAVLLSAAAVTLTGPIGFVGLCAPVLVRLLARRVTGLQKHALLIPMSALSGVLVMLASDVALRLFLGEEASVMVPTGVVTSLVGASVLVWLARGSRDSGPTRNPPVAHAGTTRTSRSFVVMVVGLVVLTAACGLAGMLAGDTFVLLGDLTNWVQGRTGLAYTFVLDQRLPRVLAALGAGAALAVAGTVVQGVCRNPLAEPSLLGITAGAGLGAVMLLTMVPFAGIWVMSGVAGAGALVAFALVYGLSWRGGLQSDRLVLVGIGVSAGLTALTTFVIVVTDPWNTAKALTWLSGSTYGRTLAQVVPVLLALVVITPVVLYARHRLDLLVLDDDTPRILGVRVETSRLVTLGGAALLTSTAVSAVGVVGFVGLVAPHTARALVGGRHGRVVPVAMLLGAVLVSIADTVGRTVIAPAQIPAGLVTAMVGTPYFVWLLWRSRARA